MVKSIVKGEVENAKLSLLRTPYALEGSFQQVVARDRATYCNSTTSYPRKKQTGSLPEITDWGLESLSAGISASLVLEKMPGELEMEPLGTATATVLTLSSRSIGVRTSIWDPQTANCASSVCSHRAHTDRLVVQ